MKYSALDPEADRPAVGFVAELLEALRPAERILEIDAQIRRLCAERMRLRRRLNLHPRDWAKITLQAACEVCYTTPGEVLHGGSSALRVAHTRHMWVTLLAKVTGCTDYSIEKLTGRNAGANRQSRIRCAALIETCPEFRRRWRAAAALVGIAP